MTKRILLIGATGEFGSRLAQHLARISDVELVLTSRSKARAEALAQRLSTNTRCSSIGGIEFDRETHGGQIFEILRPFLVVDASGPFQGADFATVRAAITAGAHWIDLADARDYLLAFPDAIDDVARSNSVAAFAGASSTPALSMSVVAALTQGWRRIDSADLAIFPAGATRVGRAVIEAILSYAGRPVSMFLEGRPALSIGWGAFKRPGVSRFKSRRIAPVETADSALMPKRFGIGARVAFHAGLQSRLERFGIRLLAKGVQHGASSNLRPLAPLLEKCRSLTRAFASCDGGMSVEVRGLDEDGYQTHARWLLLAERNDGPHVPVLAALALTRKLLTGFSYTGASVADAALCLEDIEAEMAPLAITTNRRKVRAGPVTIFEAACGSADYALLPAAVRAFHATTAAPVWQGRATIAAGNGVLARAIRWAIGFASAGDSVPVTVSVDRKGGEEIWTRNFADRRFSSRLSHGPEKFIVETFGPFSILLAPAVRDGRLVMPVRGWRLLGLPLPAALAPLSQTCEFADARERFHFDVRISAPLAGLIVHYQGWLEPLCPNDAPPRAVHRDGIRKPGS